MQITALSTTELWLIIVLAVIVVAGITAWLILRKRRTERLRTQFGGTEYARAVKEGGTRKQAEAGLDKRTERVEGLHVRPLAPADRARFEDSWRRIQARFVTAPPARSRKPISSWVT